MADFVPEIIVAHIEFDLAKIYIGDMRTNVVQKWRSWENDDNGVVKTRQKIFEPGNRFQIELVGRLIEEQNIRLPKQRLREQDTHFLCRFQAAHTPVVQIGGNTDTFQQRTRFGFGFIAAQFGEFDL